MKFNNQLVAPAVAIGAMALAVVLALVGRAPASPASAAWPEAVEQGLDHIAAADFAARALADPASVVLVDVRPKEEFDAFHLKGARHLPLPELLGDAGEALLAAAPGRLVVLYSNGMTHPAQAWVELTRRGYTDVRVLEDGLDGLRREVLTPPSLRPGTTEARARAERPAFDAALAALVDRPSNAVYATDPERLTGPTVVSTGWLAAHAAPPVVLDARESADAFRAGHVPGARHVTVASVRAPRSGVPDELLEPAAMARLFGAQGIDADTEVVVYAEDKLQDATQVLVALATIGHERVAVLEGGLAAWRAEGRPLATDSPAPAPRTYTPRASQVAATGIDEVAAASRAGSPALLDVRPADAFRGDVATEARAGHIPGSVNRPIALDVDAGQRWRTADELRAGYAALGLRPDAPVIVTCRTGHQATLTWFTLRYLLAWPDVRWYDGSFTEWAARTDLPVASGPPRR